MIYSFFVACFLGGWLVISALTVAKLIERPKWDCFHMFARWTLFAADQNTRVAAFAIFYRDRFTNGTFGPLQSVTSGVRRWRPTVFIWGPELYSLVFLRRIAKQLKYARVDETLKASEPYRRMKHFVCAFPRRSDSEARQFVILADDGGQSSLPGELVFSSDYHSLP